MWTDERVEMLKKLWAEGLSASQIAKRIGGVTRNGVIGKIHRLGLSSKERPRSSGGKAKPSVAAKAKVPPVERRASKAAPSSNKSKADPVDLPVSLDVSVGAYLFALENNREGVPLLNLRDRQCRNPIGTDGNKTTLFCGKDTGSIRVSYCEACNRRHRVADGPKKGRPRKDAGLLSQDRAFP